MKPGKTELRLNAEIEKRGALFAVLLDPDTSDEAAFVKAGAMAAENGADLLLVGGSYLGNFTLPKQVAALKARWRFGACAQHGSDSDGVSAHQ